MGWSKNTPPPMERDPPASRLKESGFIYQINATIYLTLTLSKIRVI